VLRLLIPPSRGTPPRSVGMPRRKLALRLREIAAACHESDREPAGRSAVVAGDGAGVAGFDASLVRLMSHVVSPEQPNPARGPSVHEGTARAGYEVGVRYFCSLRVAEEAFPGRSHLG
jgi:hypothetical protein